MVRISIEIEKIGNGFMLSNSYLDEKKYSKTFQEALAYANTSFLQFEEDELK